MQIKTFCIKKSPRYHYSRVDITLKNIIINTRSPLFGGSCGVHNRLIEI